MNSRQGPPNPRRHSPADPRIQHFSRAPPFPGRGGPPPMNGRTMNGRGRFDDRGGRGRGGARMQPMGMRDGARTVARPPPPPPPGRGFRGRMPPGRGPMMVRGPPLAMHGHYPRPSPGPARMIPPPPPPPPPPEEEESGGHQGRLHHVHCIQHDHMALCQHTTLVRMYTDLTYNLVLPFSHRSIMYKYQRSRHL